MARKFDPVCTPVFLPDVQQIKAAERAVDINPINRPNLVNLAKALGLCGDQNDAGETARRIAVLTSKYWGPEGVRLTVGFPWGPANVNLKKRIVQYLHKWNEFSNVEFVYTEDARPMVRCSLRAGGYYAYLGPDCLQIPVNQPNLNLEAFSLSTAESEYERVVPHEAGHLLGFPHEHMRRAIIDDLNAEKVIAEFMRTQGWTREDVIAQILTPLDESALIATPVADTDSIMCYQLPGRLTKSGKPVLGGTHISKTDAEFAARIYPKPGAPRPPEGGDPDFKARVGQFLDDVMKSADDLWYGLDDKVKRIRDVL
jgi:hypothetical protein